MMKKEERTDVRINKYISDSGFCSRRDADKLVADERVTINGVVAKQGSRVAEGDKVKIDGEPLYYIPMEQREYKLRRYGSSRRKVEPTVETTSKRAPRERTATSKAESRQGQRKTAGSTRKENYAFARPESYVALRREAAEELAVRAKNCFGIFTGEPDKIGAVPHIENRPF